MVAIANILVGYDAFEREEALPPGAIALARQHDAALHVVNVTPAPPRWQLGAVSWEELQSSLVESRRQRLEALVAEAGVEARVTVRTGAAHEEIIREAAACAADVVLVMDEPQKRDGDRGFAAVTHRLFRACPAPVIAQRSSTGEGLTRVLAAVDVEPTASDEPDPNARVLDFAATVARGANAQLVVMSAWSLWGEQLLRSRGRVSPEDMSKLLADYLRSREELLAELMSKCDLTGVDVRVELVKGDAHHVLPRFVVNEEIDLVVMGTVSRTGVKGVIVGNTAERLLDRLSCSVLVVKPEGFRSPVALSMDDFRPTDH